MGHIYGQKKETNTWTSTIVTENGAFQSGDLVGAGLTAFTDPQGKCNSGRIRSVTVIDKDRQKAPMDVFFFSSSLTGEQFVNNAAPAFNVAASRSAFLGFMPIDTWKDASNVGVGFQGSSQIDFQLDTNNTLYALPILRGTPTYTGVASLIMRLGIEQD